MINEDIHQRARALVLEQTVSALAGTDAAWLEAHLEECVACRTYADSTQQAIFTLRGMSEMPTPALVRATQRSVRLAARNLGDVESQRHMLIVSCIFAAIWGAAMQPVLWRLFGWVGSFLELPAPAWQAAFIATWLLPGIAAVLLLALMPAPSWIRKTGYKGGDQ